VHLGPRLVKFVNRIIIDRAILPTSVRALVKKPLSDIIGLAGKKTSRGKQRAASSERGFDDPTVVRSAHYPSSRMLGI